MKDKSKSQLPYYERQRVLPGRYWLGMLIGALFFSLGAWFSERLSTPYPVIIAIALSFLLLLVLRTTPLFYKLRKSKLGHAVLEVLAVAVLINTAFCMLWFYLKESWR